jgi:hypothetical protein
MLLAPSSHALLRLTQFTWHDGISNLVSLITKTKLGLLEGLPSGAGQPHLQVRWPVGPTVQCLLRMMVLHRLKDASTPFIQVGLIQGSRINATPYIYGPVPPSLRPSWNPNSYLSFRSTHTKRIKSRALQCSRLVVREWGSSWAHAQVLDLILEARQSLVYSLLHLVRLVINLSYSYLYSYAYFEYISCLVKVIITFVCGFIERLACFSLSIGLVAEPRVSMVLIRCSTCEYTLFSDCVVAAGGGSPVYPL